MMSTGKMGTKRRINMVAREFFCRRAMMRLPPRCSLMARSIMSMERNFPRK